MCPAALGCGRAPPRLGGSSGARGVSQRRGSAIREASALTRRDAGSAEILGDDGTSAIWVADATRGTLGRVTAGAGSSPVWTADGQQVVFASPGDGEPGFFRQSADGTGAVERLVTLEARGLRAGNLSPDGSRLVFSAGSGGAGLDIGVLTMDGERSWTPLLATASGDFDPVISPDGQWIAYASGETGRVEVYVQRFPELGLRQQISTDGGMRPAWSPDGRALFYLVPHTNVCTILE